MISDTEKLIIKHEGTKKLNGRHIMYKDSKGIWTIGYGRNLEKGISEATAQQMFKEDMEEVYQDCESLNFYSSLDPVRRVVIENMVYNMGLPTFNQFTRTKKAIAEQRYEDAARFMLESLWAKQVGPRAVELANMMKTGEWNV